MIISHKNKFIFIKTKKTAGTSIEIALSKFCGPDDIITPISPEDELIRKKLGYRGPQNYEIPFSKYSPSDWVRTIIARKRLRFLSHSGAAFIQSHIDKKIWGSYFKFCFERNPWDKAVSWHAWKTRKDSDTSLSEHIQSGKLIAIKGSPLYTHMSKIVVDRIFKYEELDSAMEEITKRLNLPEKPELVSAKAHYRKKEHGSYRDLLSEADKNRIAQVFADEIAGFGYKW